MKAILTIRIKKVGAVKLDGNKDTNVISSTEKTISTLCKKIDEYFKQYNIKTKTTFILNTN